MNAIVFVVDLIGILIRFHSRVHISVICVSHEVAVVLVAVLSGILFHARVHKSVICVSHEAAVVLVAVVSGWVPL
jgi:hypothetical protein